METPSDQALGNLKRELIRGINKETTLRQRFALLLTGLLAAFNPGRTAVTIGIAIVKNLTPEVLQVFVDLAEAED